MRWSFVLILVAAILLVNTSAFDTRPSPKNNKAAPKAASADEPLISTSASSKRGNSDEGLVFQIEHCLSEPTAPEQWTSRGTITARLARNARVGGVADLQQFELTAADKAKYHALFLNKAMYRIRVFPIGFADKAVYTSIPTCALAAAEFRETWTLHLDAQNSLNSIDYGADTGNGVAANACSRKRLTPSEASKLLPSTVVFRPADYRSVRVAPTIVAERPVVEIIDPIAKGAQAAPEPSFLRKYWYILLPVALMMLMGGGEQPQQQRRARSE